MQSVMIKILKFVHLHKEMFDSVKWRGGEKGGREGKLVILIQQNSQNKRHFGYFMTGKNLHPSCD